VVWSLVLNRRPKSAPLRRRAARAATHPKRPSKRSGGRVCLSLQLLRPMSGGIQKVAGKNFTENFKNKTEKQSFSDVRVRVRVRKFRTLKTLRTRTQHVCLFTHLYSKEVNISQNISEISIFSIIKSYYSLYKPHAQISTIVKTS
jgi:hypothetical protein